MYSYVQYISIIRIQRHKGREINTHNYGNRKFPYTFVVLHNPHPLKCHKPAVRVAVYHLSAHFLPQLHELVRPLSGDA